MKTQFTILALLFLFTSNMFVAYGGESQNANPAEAAGSHGDQKPRDIPEELGIDTTPQLDPTMDDKGNFAKIRTWYQWAQKNWVVGATVTLIGLGVTYNFFPSNNSASGTGEN